MQWLLQCQVWDRNCNWKQEICSSRAVTGALLTLGEPEVFKLFYVHATKTKNLTEYRHGATGKPIKTSNCYHSKL